MTSIDAISISGIRSFDPDPHNAQRILFKKPLTVILGKNGAGKTTVIESLLNACTGAMPPGCGEKASFIYDPKVACKSSVKAHIRLDITAKGGSKVSVIRKLESTKKNTKLSFSTLDSVIVLHDEATGKPISNSYRASDCDKMVPEFLGVSKAVLEHVIFCHQEDSNWPLQSPADVKAKFDDIFASSEYVAALDKLREVIKGYKQQRDVDESNLRDYKGKRDEATLFRDQIERDKTNSQTLFQQSREIDPKIRQISEAIGALDSIAHNAEQTDREIATLNGRIEERERANKEIANKGLLKNVQQNQFQNPQQALRDLKATRESFTAEARRIHQECVEAEGKLGVNRQAKDNAERTVNQITMDIEFRQRAEREHKRRVDELRDVLKLFSTNEEGGGEFVVGDAALDEKALLRIERKLQEDLAAANAALQNEKTAGEKATEEAKAELDVLIREFDADPPRRRHYEETIKQSNRTIGEKNKLLAQCIHEGNTIIRDANIPSTVALGFVPPQFKPSRNGGGQDEDEEDGNTGRITRYFQSTIADLEQRIAAANATRMAGAWHKEEERLVSELNSVNNTLASLRSEISARSAEAEDTKRLAIVQEQLTQHNAEFTRQLAEATGFLQQAQIAQHNALIAAGRIDPAAFPNGPTSLTPTGAGLGVVTLAFENLLRNREVDLQQAHAAAQSADRNLAVAAEQLGKKKEELTAAERSLTQQTAIFRSAQSTLGPDILGNDSSCENFDKIVNSVQQRMLESKQAISSLIAMRDCYAAFISTANSDHKCAVCDTDLTDKGLADFVHKNEERQQTAPQQIEEQKRRAAHLEKGLHELRRIEPVVAQILRLRESIPALTSEIEQLKTQHEQLAAVYATSTQRRHDAEASFREVQTFVQANIAALNSKRDSISSVAVQEQALAGKLRKIREQQQQQSGAGGRSGLAQLPLKDLEQQHASAMDALNALSTRLQDVRREKMAEERGLTNDPLKASLDLHQKHLYALGPLIRQCTDVAEDIRVATVALNKASAELTALTERRQQLQQLMDAARAKFDRVQQNTKKRVAAATTQVQTHEKSVQTLAQSSQHVKAYIINGEVRKLQTDRDKLVSARDALEREKASIAQIEAQIRDCRHFLDNQNKVVNTIDQQLAYFQNIEDARTMSAQKQNLEAQLTKLKDDNLRHVAALLGARYDPSKSIQSLRGVLQTQLISLERDKAHHQGSIDSIETAIKHAEAKLAQPDLERADDNYMSTFVKLHTTDLVVKDLEKYFLALEKAIQSYHQEKIQQINQLIAEYWRQTYRGSDIDTIEIKAEDEITASGAINTRKSYKYRLVMRKGNAELDMRGRCSAGQKVLASVVIRLALSEAFCCECGVLALDEPTTNMDEDNAQSLALALKDLIDARRNASNFQLIVITHDETFVRALGGQSVMDTYYFVHKDRAGEFSVIEELAY